MQLHIKPNADEFALASSSGFSSLWTQ